MEKVQETKEKNNNILSKNTIIFILMGAIYCLIEILWRGYTHPSMFFVGGLCGLLIGLLDEYAPKMNLVFQCFAGSIIVTTIEFISGTILNLWLHLNVWDYSNLPFNLLGQVSLLYSVYWFFLSFVVIKIDDWFRYDILN